MWVRRTGDVVWIDAVRGAGALARALPGLEAASVAVVCRAAAWERLTGRLPRRLFWRRGYEALAVDVLAREGAAPAPRALPSGLRATRWSPEHLDAAAQLMASAPDPLQARLPEGLAAERALLTGWADARRGALVWRDAGLVGLVTARPGEIGQVYVTADARGIGLGGWLLDVGLRDAGPGRVRLTMVTGNRPAGRLYRRRGFGRVDGYPVWLWRR